MAPTYWQIAAGSHGRDYSDLFLRYGLAFVGGDAQRAAMKQVKPGDIILLKRGISKLVAAGVVVERDGRYRGDQREQKLPDKHWLRDYDGWDLSAWCNVEWRKPTAPVTVRGFTRSTIQRVPKARMQQVAEALISRPALTITQEQPQSTREVKDGEILNFLIGQGLRPGDADALTATLRRIRLLANYYFSSGTLGARGGKVRFKWSDVREHETRTFLVVPLLLALGWSEQQIKIELPCENGRIDIACFGRAYSRDKTDCQLIVETKDFGSGLDFAPKQAAGYATDFKNCQVLVVTNGCSYKTYRRDARGDFSTTPSAYLNIRTPRDRYPVDPKGVDGSLGVLRWLMPQNLGRPT